MKQLLLAFSILVVCIPTQSQTDQFPITIQEVKKSFGAIIFKGASKQVLGRIGTSDFQGGAFFLDTRVRGKRAIVTSGHIIDALKKFAEKHPGFTHKVSFAIPENGWDNRKTSLMYAVYETHKCQKHRRADIAVCTLAEDPFEDSSRRTHLSARPISDALELDGTEVAITGFPPAKVQPVTIRSAILGYEKEDGMDMIWVGAVSWPGISGSPLYTIDGTVVGVVMGGLNAITLENGKRVEMNFILGAVPSFFVRELVDKLNAEGFLH